MDTYNDTLIETLESKLERYRATKEDAKSRLDELTTKKNQAHHELMYAEAVISSISQSIRYLKEEDNDNG